MVSYSSTIKMMHGPIYVRYKQTFHEQISSQQRLLVKIIKRRRMKMGWYVARIGEIKANKILSWKTWKERTALEIHVYE